VLKAVGGNETIQENIQDWIELDEGNPRFLLFVFLFYLNSDFTVIYFY
jgi:hypothetical protein